jgi:EAL domain-containing protein (putative c-di-GMP-specific phosphodiesterase class I)
LNVSALQFRDERFLKCLFATIEETGMDPQFLELEVTENILMKHAHVAASILAPLKDKGVRVSIDNFGTGYSSLGYLRKFPLDALKIDPSFVRQIDIAPDDTTIVSAIINMGQNLGLRIIAEGVETATDLQFLKTRNCDEAQGFYLGRPVPAEQFAKLLKAQ